MKKIIMILSICMIGICACGEPEAATIAETEMESEQAVGTETENMIILDTELEIVESETEVVYSDEEIYKDVLDKLYYNISIGWDATEDISYLFYWEYSPIQGLSDVGYSFMDLDGNGVSELVVTTIPDAKNGIIYDLYTNIEGDVIHLASSGERDMYYLCQDNTIYVKSSNGAANSVEKRCFVENLNTVLGVQDLLVYDEYVDANNLWYFGDGTCYEKESGYDITKMTAISTDEAIQYMQGFNPMEITLQSFAEYTPQGDIPAEMQLKKAAKEGVGDAELVGFICNDYDADGKEEAFVISGTDDGWDIEGATVYFVNSELEVQKLEEYDYLFGFGGGYLQDPSSREYMLLDTGSAKFMILGGMEGQNTWVFGVRDNQVYQPQVSNQHSNFYKEGENIFAEPHEGGEGYYKYAFTYDSATGEFVQINE